MRPIEQKMNSRSIAEKLMSYCKISPDSVADIIHLTALIIHYNLNIPL